MPISDVLKKELSGNSDLEKIFQRYVVDGTSHYFSAIEKSVEKEYELRHQIAIACESSIYDVVIVGSAKLGFSVKNRTFVEFDGAHNSTKGREKKSDIDIAVVNRKYFEKISELTYEVSSHFDPEWISHDWAANWYNVNRDKSLYFEYVKHLARGWLRPDFLPNTVLKSVAWPKVCEDWGRNLDRTISVAIYSDWRYLKHYHVDHLGSLRIKIQQETRL